MPSDLTFTFDSPLTDHTFDVAKTESWLNGDGDSLLRLIPAAGATSDTVITPDLDITGLTPAIHKIVPAYTEAVGYWHRVLASFDEGATYKTFGTSGWQTIPLSAISRYGLSLPELARVRDWGEEYESLRFAIYIVRETDGGTGGLDVLEIVYGEVESVLHSVDEDPDEGPPLQPLRGYRLEYLQPTKSLRTEAGYEESKTACGPVRRIAELEFIATNSEKDGLLSFLDGHTVKQFEWTPMGYEAPLRWVCEEPAIEAMTRNVWSIKTRFLQRFPSENSL